MVGVQINRTFKGFELSQPNLVHKILKDSWDGKNTHAAPLPEGFNSNFVAGETGMQPSQYLSIMNYVSVGTRPNITYAVNCLARFSS